jgi:hypothetical protein
MEPGGAPSELSFSPAGVSGSFDHRAKDHASKSETFAALLKCIFHEQVSKQRAEIAPG